MRKTAYLALSELDMSNIATYELWYDYVKPRYGEKAKLYFMDTDSFVVQVKTYNIFKNFAENVKARFDTSNYKLNKPLPKGKNKKVIVLMKDELGEKIMKEFVGFRAKTYCYLTDNNNEDKKHRKDTKKWIVKGKIKCEDYKQCKIINNCSLTIQKAQDEIISIILKLFLIFTKILKNIIQIKNTKFWLFLILLICFVTKNIIQY